MMNHKKSGFTLIEMMITVLIIAITTVVALWLYGEQVRRGRRVDAINAIMSISLAEERYRSNNTTYGSLSQVWGGISTTAEGYYTLSITNVSATSYTISAAAIGAQSSDTESGTSCSTLTLAMSNGTITKTPAACWPS